MLMQHSWLDSVVRASVFALASSPAAPSAARAAMARELTTAGVKGAPRWAADRFRPVPLLAAANRRALSSADGRRGTADRDLALSSRPLRSATGWVAQRRRGSVRSWIV